MSEHLPTRFTLTVERKPGPPGDVWWVVQCPEHPGLYIIHPELVVALSDVPVALEALITADEAIAKVATQGVNP